MLRVPRRRSITFAIPVGAALACVACASSEGPGPCDRVGNGGSVDTAEGELRGQPSGQVCSFLGIPYAAAPVGDLRFRPPAAPAPHEPKQAATFGSACSQIDLAGTVSGDEDCLFLNVWTPAGAPGQRPVFVFFHGGGNVSGSSREPVYDGAALAERADMVVVTVDYRLGAFGFLAHPDLSAENSPPSSGNYGLSDQIASLRWVQGNIARFGGDPDRVTIFGQSAGARAVCAMLTSSAARSLFHRAWMQSGTCDYPALATQEGFGDRLARQLGCAGDAAACLRKTSRDSFLEAAPGYPTLLEGSPYNPNVDGVLLAQQPIEVLATAAAAVPVVVASDADEVAEAVTDVPGADAYPASVEAVFGALAPSILPHYPLSDFASPHDALVRMITDARYTCPLDRTARALAGRAEGAVYRGVFARGWPAGPSGEPAAFHGLELRFLFRTLELAGKPPGDVDAALADELMGRVGAFARSGDPNGLAEAAGSAWPIFDGVRQSYLSLDTTRSVSSARDRPTCAFWDGL